MGCGSRATEGTVGKVSCAAAKINTDIFSDRGWGTSLGTGDF